MNDRVMGGGLKQERFEFRRTERWNELRMLWREDVYVKERRVRLNKYGSAMRKRKKDGKVNESKEAR